MFKKFRLEVAILLVLLLVYFVLRLPNLTLQPIFADEAIYIRWSQIMKSEPTLRFISVTDGKTPLFMWVLMPFFNIFQDPLFAGRFLSVASGVFTFFGAYFLGKQVFNSKVGLWAAFLYATTPYTVFFDRMALVDSMLSAFSIWSLNLAIWLIKEQKLKLSIALGVLLGGAWLTKTPAQINFLSLLFTILAFNFRKNNLFKLLFLWAVAVSIAFFMYNSLRLGPEFHQLSSRNSDYVFPISQLLTSPLDPFTSHLNDISDWFPKLLTWPVLGFLAYGIGLLVYRRNRFGLVILFWALIPLLVQMLLLKTFTARYLLTSIAPFLVIAGFGLDSLLEKIKIQSIAKILIGVVIFLPLAIKFDYQLVTSPPPENLPIEERRGYFEEWTAGYGLAQIAQFLIEEKKKGPVVVGTEGYFGTLPDGLFIYLDKADIPIIGGGPYISDQIRSSSKENLTFFVANRSRVMTDLGSVKLIKTYLKTKPLDNRSQDAIVIYQVLP